LRRLLCHITREIERSASRRPKYEYRYFIRAKTVSRQDLFDLWLACSLPPASEL
jgi:hypothetical protein